MSSEIVQPRAEGDLCTPEGVVCSIGPDGLKIAMDRNTELDVTAAGFMNNGWNDVQVGSEWCEKANVLRDKCIRAGYTSTIPLDANGNLVVKSEKPISAEDFIGNINQNPALLHSNAGSYPAAPVLTPIPTATPERIEATSTVPANLPENNGRESQSGYSTPYPTSEWVNKLSSDQYSFVLPTFCFSAIALLFSVKFMLHMVTAEVKEAGERMRNYQKPTNEVENAQAEHLMDQPKDTRKRSWKTRETLADWEKPFQDEMALNAIPPEDQS